MTTSARVKLGVWDFPSGNNVEVFFHRAPSGVEHLDCEWDDPPPLHPRDERFYRRVVLPKLIALVGEYTERPGPVLVLDAEEERA